MKRSEKFFPEEAMTHKTPVMVNEIKVPKNLMYLTDKLPAPNYDSKKVYKNKSESKFKLPKLDNMSVASSSATIEYQIPQSTKKTESL